MLLQPPIRFNIHVKHRVIMLRQIKVVLKELGFYYGSLRLLQ